MHAAWKRPSLAAAAFLLAGCHREPALPPPDQVYTVRGQIQSVPQRDKPLSELMIWHEPVPSFVNKDGKIVGMASMTMSFTPAPGVSLQGLAVKDLVEFTFEVRWKPPSSRLTKITKLAADTKLDLGHTP